MKKLLLCFGLAILCTSIPTFGQPQQRPDEIRGQNPDGPNGNGQPSYDELVSLVRAQTTAIRALDEQLKELERRVEALEGDE